MPPKPMGQPPPNPCPKRPNPAPPAGHARTQQRVEIVARPSGGDVALVGAPPARLLRPPLAQQIPALVQRPLEMQQPRAVRIGRGAVGFTLEQLMLFLRQRIDVLGDLLVVHGKSPLSRSCRPERYRAHPGAMLGASAGE